MIQTTSPIETVGEGIRRGAARSRMRRLAALFAVVLATILPSACPAQISGSTTTTTTLFTGTTTTTLFEPVDVTGGGRFEGTFPKGSFDVYTFDLSEPRVLVAETSNGFGGCPGDTLMDLRQEGFGGNCGGEYGDNKPCLAFDDDSGATLCSRLVHRMLAPGTWWIRVSAYGGAKLNRYFLQVDFVDRQCGNGQIEVTEDCDDGNTSAGDCCSPDCIFDPASTPCSDGVFCNGGDTCDAEGSCSKHLGNPCAGGGICGDKCNEDADNCFDPAGTVCRASAGNCDLQETCTGSSASCPTDLFLSSTTVCRASAGVCDVAESCTGSSAACPGNAFVPSATICRGSAGVCDTAESCTGSAPACPADALASSGTICRSSAGVCDTAESCTGSAPACPGDLFVSSATVCRADAGDCDVADHCTGSAAACPANAFEPADTACTSDGNVCTVDVCNGGGACQNVSNTVPCDDGLSCNGADTCQGGLCNTHTGDTCPGADGDSDCAESCGDSAPGCTNPDPDGAVCDDGIYCNGPDRCSGGSCSVHLGDPCPSPDGDSNCAEGCDEAVDACTAPNQPGAVCDDGVFCNGVDSCASGACSVHAGNPCPGADGDGDCTESCNETGDACDAADTGGSACDDGDPCTTASACGGNGACAGTSQLDCDDDDACTIDSCLGGAEPCAHEPVPDCAVLLCGDVNQDGSVKSSDALAALRTAVGTSDCNGEACVCDVDGGGKVTASDALAILKKAVGTAVPLNCKC